MLKRIITGALLVVVTVGFFFLRMLEPTLFEIYILIMSVLGTFEIVRATGNKTTFLQKAVAVAVSAAVVPLSWYFKATGMVYAYGIGLLLQLALMVIQYGKASVERAGLSLICTVYPSFLLCFMTFTNALADYSLVALILVFVISPFSDTFAYFVGCALGKKKMCPQISPKKTVAGGIGGIIGGTVGAICVWLVFALIIKAEVPAVFWFIIAGVFGSLLTELGDLVESVIKRSFCIKDMGNILPGHGGVLDRIDSVLFACPLIYFCFVIAAIL